MPSVRTFEKGELARGNYAISGKIGQLQLGMHVWAFLLIVTNTVTKDGEEIDVKGAQAEVTKRT